MKKIRDFLCSIGIHWYVIVAREWDIWGTCTTEECNNCKKSRRMLVYPW